jgi:hypothetical protein
MPSVAFEQGCGMKDEGHTVRLGQVKRARRAACSPHECLEV